MSKLKEYYKEGFANIVDRVLKVNTYWYGISYCTTSDYLPNGGPRGSGPTQNESREDFYCKIISSKTWWEKVLSALEEDKSEKTK